MNLGEKLKKTLEELERAQIKTATAQHNADLEKIRKERQTTMNWLYGIRDDFVDKIDDGKVPAEKINVDSRHRWLELAKKGNAANQDIWEDFIQFWKDEGLEVMVQDRHDGGGTYSWKVITLNPLPNLSHMKPDPRLDFMQGLGNYSG
jgi:hypothetical protein